MPKESIQEGQTMLYDGCDVTVVELWDRVAIVETKQKNRLKVRYEFLFRKEPVTQTAND